MNKNKAKFFVDFLMFIDFLIVAISGFVLWLVLPRGGGGGRGSFILLREQWIHMHDFASVILVVLLIIHLILNWQWIKAVFRNTLKSNKRV